MWKACCTGVPKVTLKIILSRNPFVVSRCFLRSIFKNSKTRYGEFQPMGGDVIWSRSRSLFLEDNMEALYGLYFHVLELPHIKIKKPSWVKPPSAMVVFCLVLLSYFLVTGGIIYDVIVEPPSIGSTTDENGNSKPVAFMPYRVNGQYIMEGLAASFMFSLGGLGFIVLDKSNAVGMPKLNRFLLLFLGFLCVIVAFVCCRVFMKMKLPGYLSSY